MHSLKVGFFSVLRSIQVVVRMSSSFCLVAEQVLQYGHIAICSSLSPLVEVLQFPVLDYYKQNCCQNFCATLCVGICFFSFFLFFFLFFLFLQTQEFIAGPCDKLPPSCFICGLTLALSSVTCHIPYGWVPKSGRADPTQRAQKWPFAQSFTFNML